MPFQLESIPTRIGLVGMGTMLACLLAFIYSLFMVKHHQIIPATIHVPTQKKLHTLRAAITGLFIGTSILISHLLHLSNPYWVPISCMAVMQGASLEHIWQRSFHRIIGTLIGLGFAWLILLAHPSPIIACLIIF